MRIPLAFEVPQVNLSQSIFHPNGAFLSALQPALICVRELDTAMRMGQLGLSRCTECKVWEK